MNSLANSNSLLHSTALGVSALAIFSVGVWYPTWYAAYYHDNDFRGGGAMALAFVVAAVYAVRALASFTRWMNNRSHLRSDNAAKA